MTYQDLCNAAKAIVRGKFIAIQARKELGKEQMKPKVSRRKEINVRGKINEIETKKTIEKINETKSWFFE